MSTTSSPFGTDMYSELLPLVTAERLGSYLRASGGDVSDAFALYEWNMRAAASIMELTSMVEVLARNALDRELRDWAHQRRAGASWLDFAPLDPQGSADIQKARDRATRRGRRAEVHGRVIAELPLGFWRFLVESRYLTALWILQLTAHSPTAIPIYEPARRRSHSECSNSTSCGTVQLTTSRSIREISAGIYSSLWISRPGSRQRQGAGSQQPHRCRRSSRANRSKTRRIWAGPGPENSVETIGNQPSPTSTNPAESRGNRAPTDTP